MPHCALILSTGPSAYFYGWDIFTYVWVLLSTYFKQYSWQVRVSFCIIAMSAVTVLVLAFFFTRMLVKRKRRDEEYKSVESRFINPFREILGSEEKFSIDEIEYVCSADQSELQKVNPDHYLNLITMVRMEYIDRVYLPNIQLLCELCGVETLLENNLVNGKDVQRTFQILMTLPLSISEGVLATYTGNRDPVLRELARTCDVYCSKTEPFHYVVEDIQEDFNPWYPTIFHRQCAWHHAQQHPLPMLLSLAKRSTNKNKIALLLAEVPYWGTDEEKMGLRDFLEHSSARCRLAAIEAIAQLGDPSAERNLMACYDMQHPDEKRAILKAILQIGSGRQVAFLERAYHKSTSQTTRAMALTCLYNYGPEGREAFERLKSEQSLDNSQIFDQITNSQA